MVVESSLNPLSADGNTSRDSRHSSKSRSKGSSPDHCPDDGSQAEDSPSSAESQPSLLSQLGASQPNINHIIQHDGNEQYHISQIRGKGRKSSCYPEEDPGLAEEVDSFVFAPQPKYKPNQFSGHQQRRSIDFGALSERQDTVPQDDMADPGNAPTAQPRERPVLINGQGHHCGGVDAHVNDAIDSIHRSDQTRSGTQSQRSRITEVNSQQLSGHVQLPTRGHSDQITTSPARDPAQNHNAERPSIRVEQKVIEFAKKHISIRPFADADAILPCDQREALQPALERTPATEKCIASRPRSSRGDNEGERQQRVISDRMGSVTNGLEHHLSETSKPVKDNCMLPRKVSQVQGNDTVEVRSSTPLGDLEMPQKQTPGSARKASRQHSSPREQSVTRVRHEHTARDVPRRTKSRLSNTSRRRRHSFRQPQYTKPSHEKVAFDPKNQQVTAESHYETLESMSAHYNKVLSYSKEVEHKMNSRLMGQKQQIEELKTRLGQYQTRYQKDCDRRVLLNSELSLAHNQKGELSQKLAQQGGRMHELEQEVANLQADRKMQDEVAASLHDELEVAHSKLDKLQEKSRSYKDHLNKAVAEHQQLWHQSRDVAQKTIISMRKEHHEAEEKFNLVMAEKQAAQDKLNRISKDRQVLLQQEVAAAASQVRHMTSALGNLEKDFHFEVQRVKGLEEERVDANALKSLLHQIDERVAEVSLKMDDLQACSIEAPAMPTKVMKRLGEIADHVQFAPHLNVEDEIRRALKTFQREIMPRFSKELEATVSGQSIEEKLQSLQKTLQDQLLATKTERKDHHEQLMLQLSETKEENNKLAQGLLAKDAEIVEMTNSVCKLNQKLQEARDSAEWASNQAATTEEELRALEQSLLGKDCQLTKTQTELHLQREGHEAKVRELQEKLRIAEEDAHHQRQLAEESEKKLAEKSEEDTEMQTRPNSPGESLHQARQQLTMAMAEVERLKALESVIRASKLENELENARQRITNLTLKLRDTQVPAANNSQLDQVAEQLAQLQTLKEDIKQLRSNGKAYVTISKNLAETLDRKDTTESDEILIPDSLVLPMLPALLQQDVYDPLNNFQPSSSDIPLIRASKRTVFRSPVEESEDELPVPSVEQEKSQRVVVATQGSRIRSILRPQRTPTARTSKGSTDAMVARHAGHSSYNRPVQSAPKSSQEAILDVKNSLVGNRKAILGDLANPNEWERLEGPANHAEQRGSKRPSNSQQWSRGPKRSKPCFTENEDNVETSQVARSSMEDRLQAEPPERSKDGNKVPAAIAQDDDQVSHHFFSNASKPNESAERGGK